MKTPGGLISLIDLLLAQGAATQPQAKKAKGKAAKVKQTKLGDEEVEALGMLLSRALEELRYEIERGKADAKAQLTEMLAYLLEAGQRPGVEPDALMFVLQQFVAAKVDIGDDLRLLLQRLIGDSAEFEYLADAEADFAASMAEYETHFARVAKELNGDPFAIHAMMNEITETVPEEVRQAMAVSTLAMEKVPAVREAALGWLLNDAAGVRRTIIEALEKGAKFGGDAGVTLRRMIALRNWLPVADRPLLDRAIKASQKRTTCASWPSAKVLGAYAFPGFDGAGAQSVFLITQEGRKRNFVALLFKQGFGVRDTWVSHRISAAEANELVEAMAAQMPLVPVTLDFAAAALRHFLGVNALSGALPPFSALDAAETAGVAAVNPEYRAVDELVASLCAEIDPKRATPQAVAKALKASASWGDDQPMVGAWFEDSDEVAAVLAQPKLPKAKRKAALLAVPLQKRRRWWAELIAWTAVTMNGAGAGGWEEYALVARELLGARPLDEFGIMSRIADTTISQN